MKIANRRQALQYIRDNSRMVRSTHLNPVPKHEMDEDYDANYQEQRLSNKGVPFILNDYGRHGWDVYFISGGNSVEDTIKKFNEKCLLMEKEDSNV